MNEMKKYYDRYAAGKGWNEGSQEYDYRYYRAELQRLNLPPQANILELGFGAGQFLDWGAAQGYRMNGVEIIEDLVNSAQKRGHRTHLGPLKKGMFPEKSFDLIVAFDVFEHLTIDEIHQSLQICGSLLVQEGKILIRFPNGESPFGLPYQQGDVTHRVALSRGKFKQIADVEDFDLVFNGNSARALPRGIGPGLRRRATYLLRDLLELTIGLAYFGGRIPLDPNMTVLLEKNIPTLPEKK